MSMEGVSVRIGSKTFVVPPTTFEAWEFFVQNPAEGTPSYTLQTLRVLLLANYPDITIDEIREEIRSLPMAEVREIVASVNAAATVGIKVVSGEAPSP